MKKVLLCLGLLLICIALLGGGLLPGAWIIAADSSPDESYTLDGVASFLEPALPLESVAGGSGKQNKGLVQTANNEYKGSIRDC